MKALPLLLTFVCLSSCETKFPVSFHMEDTQDIGRAFGTNDKFTIRQGTQTFEKAPFISQKDFESYRSFRAEDGTFGVVFNVKKPLWSRVKATTTQNLGSNILPMVNGHPMELIRLYKEPIRNGKLVVWGGFTPADLAVLAEVVPPLDPEREKPVLDQASSSKPNLSISPQEWAEKEKEKNERKVISEKRGRF